jgi:hypothetical protein
VGIMYQAETHDSIQTVQLREQLSLDLDITESAYSSNHELSGELRMLTGATDEVVRAREAPPRTLLGPLTAALGDDPSDVPSSYPGTRAFVGIARDTTFFRDDDTHEEGYLADTMDIQGITENGTIEFDTDWDRDEAERMRSEGQARVLSTDYEVDGLPGDRLPVIVRASLYRDAAKLAEVIEGSDQRHGGGVQRYEGQAALVLEVEHRDPAETGRPLVLDELTLELSQTFPSLEFNPSDATYDPESRRVEWGRQTVAPGDVMEFTIFGPITQLLDIETADASFRGQVPGKSMTGLQIEGVFDESGRKFLSRGDDRVEHFVDLTAEATMDPSALRGEVQEVSNASVTVNAEPEDLYQRVRQICNANGMHIRDSSDPGEADPVAGRDGVFEITESDEEDKGDAGWLRVSKEYGDRGVVYAEFTVTGQFVAISEESQVSAFDESEDRIVRADQGGLDTRGESTVDIKARSADSKLNSELISTFERELEVGN